MRRERCSGLGLGEAMKTTQYRTDVCQYYQSSLSDPSPPPSTNPKESLEAAPPTSKALCFTGPQCQMKCTYCSKGLSQTAVSISIKVA